MNIIQSNECQQIEGEETRIHARDCQLDAHTEMHFVGKKYMKKKNQNSDSVDGRDGF